MQALPASIEAAEVASSSVAPERAAKTVTVLLPFVLRLVKERIRGVILQIAERVPKPAGAQPSFGETEPVEVVSVLSRMRSVVPSARTMRLRGACGVTTPIPTSCVVG